MSFSSQWGGKNGDKYLRKDFAIGSLLIILFFALIAAAGHSHFQAFAGVGGTGLFLPLFVVQLLRG